MGMVSIYILNSMFDGTVVLSILNQIEFHTFQKSKEKLNIKSMYDGTVVLSILTQMEFHTFQKIERKPVLTITFHSIWKEMKIYLYPSYMNYMYDGTVVLSILNQMEFHTFQKSKENLITFHSI